MFIPNRLWAFLLSFMPREILQSTLCWHKRFSFIRETKNTQVPITFNHWYEQFILRNNPEAHWPIHKTSSVFNPKNIYCGIETSPGYMQCCYIQAFGHIYIGDYTQIGPNVGIISANHDFYDTRKSLLGNVHIGRYCWIAMGAYILPGVKLGDFTIVGAGSVVTKSFEEGFCVIAGNPAKIIKKLDKKKCIEYKSENEYRGYIKAH